MLLYLLACINVFRSIFYVVVGSKYYVVLISKHIYTWSYDRGGGWGNVDTYFFVYTRHLASPRCLSQMSLPQMPLPDASPRYTIPYIYIYVSPPPGHRAKLFIVKMRSTWRSRRSRLRATLFTATLIDKTHAFETCFFLFPFLRKVAPFKVMRRHRKCEPGRICARNFCAQARWTVRVRTLPRESQHVGDDFDR